MIPSFLLPFLLCCGRAKHCARHRGHKCEQNSCCPYRTRPQVGGKREGFGNHMRKEPLDVRLRVCKVYVRSGAGLKAKYVHSISDLETVLSA